MELNKMMGVNFAIVILSFNILQHAYGDVGTTFISLKEFQVMEIAGNATLNNGDCDLLTTCQSSCTRLVCNPLTTDLKESSCVQVENNEFCTSSSQCNIQMNLNYNRSYLWLSPNSDPASLGLEVIRDICLQRHLDITFSAISQPPTFSYLYYGSTSGAYRSFPGRETSGEQCTDYETRTRPWFLDAIGISKQLKILIDTGNSMGLGVNGEYLRQPGTSYLNVAQSITLELLKSMSPYDKVDISSFNSSGSYSLGPLVTINNTYSSSNPDIHPELASLEANVESLIGSSVQLPSNLSIALFNAINSFQNVTTINTLKVIVIFTDGNFAPLDPTFPTTEILALQGKVFLFKLPPNVDKDPYLLNTSLKTVMCNMKGTFEVLEAPATVNPLYSIRSYFTFMAQLHIATVSNRPTWSNPFVSTSQERDVVAVTYPVFDGNGTLIGVAAISVYLDELGNQLEPFVSAALGNQTRGTLPAPSSINLTCNYQTAQVEETCQVTSVPSDAGICTQSDNSNTLQQRVCCNLNQQSASCIVNQKHSSGFNALQKWEKIMVIVGIVMVIIALLCFLALKVFGWDRIREILLPCAGRPRGVQALQYQKS